MVVLVFAPSTCWTWSVAPALRQTCFAGSGAANVATLTTDLSSSAYEGLRRDGGMAIGPGDIATLPGNRYFPIAPDHRGVGMSRLKTDSREPAPRLMRN